MSSLSLAHKTHISKDTSTRRPLLRRLFTVETLPNSTDQHKASTLGGTRSNHQLFKCCCAGHVEREAQRNNLSTLEIQKSYGKIKFYNLKNANPWTLIDMDTTNITQEQMVIIFIQQKLRMTLNHLNKSQTINYKTL